MAKRKPKPKQASGGLRLRLAGKWSMLLGWPADARPILEAAAQADGRMMTQLVMHYGLEAAKKILAEKGISP